MTKGVYVRKPFSLEHRENLRLSRIGKHATEESRLKMSLASLGKHKSFEHRINISLSKLGNSNGLFGSDHHRWKGDDVGYRALHYWVRRNLPQPELCQFCNEKHSRHLANITGEYNRDLHNWLYLCASCHKWWDNH